MRYKEFGFKSFGEYIEHFFNTLLPTNKTYEYFVDWAKVKASVQKYLNEVFLINSLTRLKREQRIVHLKKLLAEYPRIIEVIPMLIAERAKSGKIDIYDPEFDDFIDFDFHPSQVNDNIISKISKFCDKTGIIDLFGQIKDVHDYLLGVETGLDSNARKNRSGDIFQNMVQEKVRRLLHSRYSIVNNDPNFSLYKKLAKRYGKAKTHDIVVYEGNKPLLVIECNFYNVSGSKPISIAESYPEMSRVAKQCGVEFLWVTDGPAWHKMKEPLLRAMKEMDWVVNFKMLRNIRVVLK